MNHAKEYKVILDAQIEALEQYLDSLRQERAILFGDGGKSVLPGGVIETMPIEREEKTT